jgi:hypothetical protein
MTISNKDRNDAINTALRRMLDALGDRWIGVTRFEVASDEFSDLPQTTWLELKEEMWVRTAHDSSGYAFKLTGPGLIEAMTRCGSLDSQEHKAGCVVLKTAFKSLIKGRELSGGSTDIWTLVAQTKLTDNWIWNALDARFLVQQWPDEYVDVEVRSGGRDLRVPANFGMKRTWGMEAGPLTRIPERD